MRLSDVLRWGVDIAEGMNYLSGLQLVHRDLAARNCMLDENFSVKVADFGLCRDIYEKGYYTSENKKKFPIRWVAPESIERGIYSTKSDVWSLGVVVWELLTRGATPYPGIGGWDIADFINCDRRLQQPWFCSNELYEILIQMWFLDPTRRPNFSEAGELLQTTQDTDDNMYITFPDCCRYQRHRHDQYLTPFREEINQYENTDIQND